VEVWEEVLGVEGVGIHDNFFDLGGDSIRSIQLMSKAKEQGLNFTLQQMFQHQTIAELAGAAGSVVTNADAPEHTEPYSLISQEDRAKLPADVEDAYPLARLQAGMLFHSEFSPDSSMYHNFGGMHLRARYDSEKFKIAAAQLAARHPILRTSFDMNSYSEPMQLVHREVEIPVIEHDIRHLSHDEQEKALADWKEDEKHRKFDCSRPPLVRFTIHQRSDATLQFSWTEHHSILDGWSVASMCTELFLLYFSLLGEQVQTPEAPPRATYRDFVAQERKALASEEYANYWLRKLGDGSFTGLRRWKDESGASLTGDEPPFYHEVEVSLELSDALKRTARSAGVPLKSLLLAAHMRVMSALVGGGHVQTGLVANGRSEEPGGERVLGLFLNTMPFRMKLKDGTWIELAREVFEAEKELMPFRRYPMVELQRKLGGHALFDTLFNFVHFHVYDSAKGVEDMELLSGDSFQKTNYAMTTQFNLTRTSLDVNLVLECDRERLSEEQAQTIGQYYLKTLELMAYEPQSQCFARPLLTRDEMQKLLVEWTETEAEYPRDKCVHELFEAQVEQSPDAVALIFGDEQVTYAELNSRANRLAHYLRGLGVGPESPVGVCMQRSVELIVGLLGILKAGGAFVPLDPAYPAERLAFMLEDARMVALLTLEEQSDKLRALGVRALALDTQRELIDVQPNDNPLNTSAADNLAYVMYTSGSTGQPKGVSVPHRGVVRLVKENTFARLDAREVFLQLAPVSFDASTLEIWGSLLNGARLVLMPPHAPSLEEIGKALVEHRVTTLWLTAGLFNQMVDERLAELAQVRQVLSGGDVLSVMHVEKFLEASCGRGTLVNGYGPTENTTFTCCHPLNGPGEVGASVPIGRPIANTNVYVLDDRMQPVGIGVPGELCIGGDGLARDYLNSPGLTAEKFIPHPFGARPGARLYLTGDVVRYAPDGTIEFIGRRDNQVKVRGFRIELGEIESALAVHPLVSGCAVLAREDVPGEKRLVAYVTLEQGDAPAVGEWRAFLKERLPDYMIPSAFVVLEEFPLTPNGKVDRRALPKPAAPELESSMAAPRTPTEEILAGIWTQVLGLERVGVHDDFFELGGHSLSATQLISRVREAFNVEMPLRVVFEHATVARMAAAIEAEMSASRNIEMPPITRVSRESELPLSFAQQRLWFFQQFEPGSIFYNIPLALRLGGKLDVEAFERTLGEIVRRHEVLRTTFDSHAGRPVQIINEAQPVKLPVNDLTHLPEDEREAEARRLAALEALEPFDLGAGPLMRASLLRLGREEHILLFTIHHIISDGWSMGVLVKEVVALYGAYSRDEESPLEELSIQYADYAAWQRGWLKGEVLQQQLSYWKRQVGGTLPVLNLPSDRPRPPIQSYRGAQRSMSIDKELADGLRALCRREGVTLYMLLLAAFKTLLARYTEQDDILVGTVVANRTRAEVENMLGMFINMLTMRTDLSGNPSFTELLGRVREVALGAYANQDVPFEKLVEELHPKRSLSHSPLVQVTFGLQNAPMGTLELPELRLDLVPFENESVRFDLTVWMSESEEGLGGSWTYSLDLFDESRIEQMQRRFVTLLRNIVARPETKLKALEILTDEEREQQLLKRQESERKSHKKFLNIKPTALSVSGKSPDEVIKAKIEEEIPPTLPHALEGDEPLSPEP
jgi:amino acid adenylation domain-containing protein